MYQDYPVFPAVSELLSLWPLWLLFLLSGLVWLSGAAIDQQKARLQSLRRRDALKRMEEEWHRTQDAK